MTTASGPGGIGGTWGTPMATSTPAPEYFGNSTDGFGGGSGMNQIQQMASERGSGGKRDEERVDNNRWLVQSGNGEGEWESKGGEEERV